MKLERSTQAKIAAIAIAAAATVFIVSLLSCSTQNDRERDLLEKIESLETGLCVTDTTIDEVCPDTPTAAEVWFVDIEAYEDTLERLAWSLAMVESRMTMDAVGRGGCYGPLQITITMMREANRLVGFDMFTMDDLFTWSGSVAILGVVMNAHNPSLDVRKACHIWNSRGGDRYYKRVLAYYETYEKGGAR